jgi:hypothetical protein
MILFYQDGVDVGKYIIDLVGVTSPVVKVLCEIREDRLYRPILVRVLPPASPTIVTAYLQATLGGSPPATIEVGIGADGRIPLDPLLISKVTMNLSITIDSISVPNLIPEEEIEHTAFYFPPKEELGLGRFFLLDKQGTGVGSAAYSNPTDSWNAQEEWQEYQQAGMELKAVDDFIAMGNWYDIPTCVDEKSMPNINHLALLVMESQLLNIDYSMGSIIEKGLTVGLALSGLKTGKYGYIIGPVMEAMDDGGWGDLDIMLEEFVTECDPLTWEEVT